LLQENPKESVALFILVKILRKLFSHLHQWNSWNQQIDSNKTEIEYIKFNLKDF
jgi:hypothetical protein